MAVEAASSAAAESCTSATQLSDASSVCLVEQDFYFIDSSYDSYD